ncbi:hypothetical protein [Roseicella sp. DB1501]|uniref:hypothetical protein n=1 Tax=Roseicella sp. DB1501 TaxID=2730925 RepID=UPI0014925B80|nr:hypothetical protein [Roseicella sp. DB1501]NOG74192.1 hypothetical protein [Roseicella sp. DB1501]
MPVSPKSPRPNGSVQPAGHLPRRLPEQRDGTRGPARSHEDREEEVRLARKVLKAAGVQQPEVHARRLVDLREMDDADYAPASVAWQGSAAGAREQLALLRERLHEIRTLRAELAQRTSIQIPRVGDADTLWAREVRRDQPEQFRILDRHAAQRGEKWRIFQEVQKLAPQMLSDLQRREQTLLNASES